LPNITGSPENNDVKKEYNSELADSEPAIQEDVFHRLSLRGAKDY
jgi:hypothetical protein